MWITNLMECPFKWPVEPVECLVWVDNPLPSSLTADMREEAYKS